MRVAFALTLALVLSGGTRLPASPTPAPIGGWSSRLRILVRVEVDATVKDVAVADVLAEARRIWAPYVDVEFVDAADLVESIHDDEVRLFITNPQRSPAAENPYALGWITFAERGRPANIVTVSAGAARNLRNRGAWRGWRLIDAPASVQTRFLTRAIARSVAHELGHYLLRSPAHSGWGLMRAQMSPDDIMSEDPSLVRLDAGETAQLEPQLWLAQLETSKARGRT